MDARTSLSEKETVFNLVFAAGGVRYYTRCGLDPSRSQRTRPRSFKETPSSGSASRNGGPSDLLTLRSPESESRTVNWRRSWDAAFLLIRSSCRCLLPCNLRTPWVGLAQLVEGPVSPFVVLESFAGSRGGETNRVVRESESKQGRTFPVIDLSSGVGGLSLGTASAGFEVRAAVEVKKVEAALKRAQEIAKKLAPSLRARSTRHSRDL